MLVTASRRSVPVVSQPAAHWPDSGNGHVKTSSPPRCLILSTAASDSAEPNPLSGANPRWRGIANTRGWPRATVRPLWRGPIGHYLLMPRLPKNPHGQYFTPRPVADLMVDLLQTPRTGAVLEPCAGDGVFLHALTEKGFDRLTGVEIDETLLVGSPFPIEAGSFISWNPGRKFDAVIGNPPYIRWKNLSEASKQEVQQHVLWGGLFNSLSDYLTIFVAAAVEHLNPGGELVFITPSFWMHTQHSEPLRDWLLTRGHICELVSFGESEVFPKVSSSIVIFRFVKAPATSEPIHHFKFVGGRRIPTGKLDLADTELFRSEDVPQLRRGEHWTLADSETQADLDALEISCYRIDSDTLMPTRIPTTLGDVVDIANGMVSGLDKAFRFPTELIPSLNEREKSALLTVVKAFQLEPLATSGTCAYINIPLGLSDDEARTNYPRLIAHLEPYREALEGRYSYGRDLPFWDWAFRRSEKFFLNGRPKAMVPCKERLTNKDRVRFALAPAGAVATQDVTAFAPKSDVRESLAFVVGYLSHPAITSWIRTRGLMKGGVAEFSQRPLSQIPFRMINWSSKHEVSIHDEITTLVEASSDLGLDAVLDKVAGLVDELLTRR